MKENSEIMLMETPNIGINAMAPRNEIGIPRVIQNASRRRKNRASTTKTSTSPVSALSTRSPTRLSR